ncbi:MAG: DUF401 family protein [Acidilobaceae archaeon]
MADAILVGLLVVLVVLIASLAKLPPSVAVALASLIASITLGLDVVPYVYKKVLTNFYTFETLAGVGAVAWLVSLYRNTGLATTLGEELSKALKNPKIAAIGTPALLGLLPVPGGALMSAPIIDEIGRRLGWDSEKKLFINVWFRHALVIAYPLNSVMIVAASIAGVSLWAIAALSLIASISMILIGLMVIGRDEGEALSGAFDKNSLARGLVPMLATIIIAILGEIAGLSSRLSVLIAVLSSVPLFLVFSQIPYEKLLAPFRDHTVWDILVVTFSALVLREVFSLSDYSSINSLDFELRPLLVVALPTLFGFFSGAISIGVSISLPMISSFYPITVKEVTLIYIAAFIGYMISPLHLCLIYTLQYYNISLLRSYRLLVPTSIALLAIVPFVFLALLPT